MHTDNYAHAGLLWLEMSKAIKKKKEWPRIKSQKLMAIFYLLLMHSARANSIIFPH